MSVSQWFKALVAVAGAIVISVQVAIEDGIFTSDEWFTIAVAAITAIGVYLVPNTPKGDQ